MKILAIGDIVGNTGIKKVKDVLPKLKEEYGIDFIIANGENSADGRGINQYSYDQLMNLGVDVITLGNHTWSKKEVFELLENKNVIRPANFYSTVPGKGYNIFTLNNKKIAVINLIGRVYIENPSDNPFNVIDKILEEINSKADVIIVDFHAEATAEKIAMAYHIKDRATVLFGTHTHVQTADDTVLDGMGYITDLGMTGPKVSVLGLKVEIALKRFIHGIPERYKMSEEGSVFNGCIFEIDDDTCKCLSVNRLTY